MKNPKCLIVTKENEKIECLETYTTVRSRILREGSFVEITLPECKKLSYNKSEIKGYTGMVIQEKLVPKKSK